MKNNNQTSFIIASSILVLVVFCAVSAYNIIPSNTKSDSYYVKVNEDMDAKIEGLYVDNNILTIKTSGNAIKFCVKSTKSTPRKSSICWKDIQSNKAKITVYYNKKYYIWIMDKSETISSPLSINANE